MSIAFERIPKSLTSLDQWVLWKSIVRGGLPTKVPFSATGELAKADDPSTWATYEAVCHQFERGVYDGIGFEFADDDGLCGIDLDGCRDPTTGTVSEWAREIIVRFDTYAEVSPSLTGVKLFVIGKSPSSTGRKNDKLGVESVCDKTPAIEVYDRKRYFAVTGWRLKGQQEPQHRQGVIDELFAKFFPAVQSFAAPVDFRSDDAVTDRARKYLERVPAAVSGSSGHNQTFHAACVLVQGFGLSADVAYALLAEYNQRCEPPWTERELRHKITSAEKQPGERNYLRNAAPDRWDAIKVPSYASPVSKEPPKVVTLSDAARKYIDSIRDGQTTLIELGVPDVDYAIGGGVEPGEMVILAARPSHGKSAVALQCCHAWTLAKRPTIVISEEMSALMLGKRTLQFVTEVPQEHWSHSITELERDITDYDSDRATCFVVESVGTVDRAVECIERAIDNDGVQCAVVDYAQLLGAKGNTSYERTSQVSKTLKALAARRNIVLVALCQMSREIEGRNSFVPKMSDIKETGQLEQDADVILFLVWPHRLDSGKPPEEYMFFVAKNRNRAINMAVVKQRFLPSRQMILPEKPKNHDKRLSAWNAESELSMSGHWSPE